MESGVVNLDHPVILQNRTAHRKFSEWAPGSSVAWYPTIPWDRLRPNRLLPRDAL